MCGRFTSSTQLSLLAERFRAEPVGVEGHQPSWNVTPVSDVLVIIAGTDGARQLRKLRWGLVPKWAKDPSGGARMINLRAETVREKKSWQTSLARRRCIIPIDGFYEWQDMGKGNKKQPIYITTRESQPLALAGLWETWRDRSASEGGDDTAKSGQRGDAGSTGGGLWTCTILTTTPNKLLASVHHRMPVILPPETWDAWLDPANANIEALTALLVPAADDLLVCWPVDTAVNSPRSKGPELTRPLEGHEPRTID
jgi:putative SOS response-associated peptidase YedK